MRGNTCCIIGGGPAGMVLGLLLARCGVHVTVLEKHADFLRDFRGDTVHPTTLSLLDDLGLAERFERLPQNHINRVQIPIGNDEFLTLGDFTLLPIKHNYIAMVPQWDFLDLLAEAGSAEPTFTLRMNTGVTGLVRENGRVNGVRYRTSEGEEGEIRATITAACDGRDSPVRELPELALRDFPTPMDVRWFRIPRISTDPAGVVAKVSGGRFLVLLDRGDYFQVASVIGKDTDAAERTQPVTVLERALIDALPWLAGRGRLLSSWDEVKLLHVRLDRLRKWHLPGLLCLGDAAHAMSPVGGVGINLAVQDGVAAARHLAEPLRQGRLRRRHIAAVQRRRWPTTVLVQEFQRAIHANVVGPALRDEITFADGAQLPLPVRAVTKVPWLRRIPPYLLAYGARRERPPAAARR